MKCNSTLKTFIALTIALSVNTLAQSQHVYVSNGGSASYNLAAGDSLYISSGVYQGYIGQFDNGAKITIAAGASFQPTGINNPRGAVRNLGTVKISNWFGTNGGFSVENYGTFWFASGMALNQGPQTWNNYFGATLRFDAGVTINGSTVVNKGKFISTGDVTINSSTSFTNNNEVNITGTFTVNGSSFNNGGKFNSTGMTFNNNATVNNTCRLAVDGPITNNSQNIYNGGLIWSSAAKGNSKITNTGSITNYADGILKSVDFYNSGTLSGSGYWYFTGYTENYGTVGVNGTQSNFLKIYDVTRTSPSKIFDVQYGNVYASAKYTVQSAPDTVATMTSCSSEARNALLPVKWEYFYVNLSDNTPVLSWGAEQDPGTVFNVERSYDGVNFTVIASIGGKDDNTSYKYEDRQVSVQAKSVYYRIRAIELTGSASLSDTRVLTFSNKTGVSVQAAPNPFTSQLNISYQSLNREKINIRIISMTGVIMAAKAVDVSIGYNSIAITEASSLVKGIYLVQLISENKVIASERVVKQ